MSNLFVKGVGRNLFSKGSGKNLFRKAYNSLSTISKGVDKVGNISGRVGNAIMPYNPTLGGVANTISSISPLVKNTLDTAVSNAKQIKKSIERRKPIKEEQQNIFS